MNYKQLMERRQNKEIGDSVFSVYCRYLNYRDYYQQQQARTAANWNMYLPIDTEHGYGQYPADVIAALIAQKRAPLTFNMAKPTCDLIASGLVQAPFDPKFYPVNTPITWLTKAVEKAMYSDKEITDWPQAYFELVRAGLVIQGDVMMSISNDFSRLGNIAMKNCLPNSVMYAPAWKTANTRDCPRCMHEQYLMPEEALLHYGEISDQITAGIKSMMAGDIELYGERTGAVPFSGQEGRWGSALQFIHEYHIETKRMKKTYILTQEGEMVIPSELTSQKEPGAVMDWLDQTFGFEKWDSENIFEDTDSERVCIKTTIAPGLLGADVIEQGMTEVQIGQIPFFTWSCDRVNGEPHGVIDQISDAQRTINYWNSLIQHKIQTEGGGGGKYIDKSKFATPEDAERAVEFHNDPTQVFSVKAGAMDSGSKPISPINSSSGVPSEVYAHLDRIINQYWPLISKTTPASRGMLEGSNQSGYLYNLQKIQSDQMVYTIHYSLRQFWNQFYTAYLLQAGKTYANEGVPRVFYFRGGKESITLNERVNFPDGSIGIRNDMSKLGDFRHKIIISDQQQSPTKDLQDLTVMSEYLKSIVPMAQMMPASVSYTLKSMTHKIPQFDEEDKDNLDDIQSMELEGQLATLELNTVKTQIETIKAKKVLESEMNPMQPVPAQAVIPQNPAIAPVPVAQNNQAQQVPQPIPQGA